jgi:hypothetical protein
MTALAGREALVKVTCPPGGRRAAGTFTGRVLAAYAGPCLLVAAGDRTVIADLSAGYTITEIAEQDAGYVTTARLAEALDRLALAHGLDLPPSAEVAAELLRTLREEL